MIKEYDVFGCFFLVFCFIPFRLDWIYAEYQSVEYKVTVLMNSLSICFSSNHNNELWNFICRRLIAYLFDKNSINYYHYIHIYFDYLCVSDNIVIV